MATRAFPGPGFVLAVGAGGTGTVYTAIPGVQDIKALPLSTDIHDITNQSSTGGYEEVIPTIQRSGETSFPMIFDPADATQDDLTGLQYLRNNKILSNFRLTVTTPNTGATFGKKLNFTGYVVGFDITAPVNGVMTADTKIKVTGQPTWA